jgi:hypothetical protein
MPTINSWPISSLIGGMIGDLITARAKSGNLGKESRHDDHEDHEDSTFDSGMQFETLASCASRPSRFEVIHSSTTGRGSPR